MSSNESPAPALAEEVSWDDPNIKAPPSTSNVKMGRFKGVQDKTNRLLLLDTNPVMIYQHFKRGFGYFRCLKTLSAPGRCAACDSGDRPAQKFNVNVLAYPDDAKIGTDVTPENIKVLVWSFGIKVFNDLKGIKAEWGDLTNFDIKVTCTNAEYQHLSVAPCKERLFDNSPKAKDIDAGIHAGKFDLKHRLSKSLTEEQVLGVWSGKLKSEDIFKKKDNSPNDPNSSTVFEPYIALTPNSEGSAGNNPAPQKLDLNSLL